MPTRIRTGISVQATSIRVLWVVREGTGLALALNFTTTVISSASTNSVMMVMIQSSMLWNQVICSITGDRRFLQLVFPRRRLPQFGECRPACDQRNAGHRQPQQPPADLALRHLHAARAPLIEPLSTPPAGRTCRTNRPLTNGLGGTSRYRARSLERVEIQPLKP